jgi:hypothetical protein
MSQQQSQMNTGGQMQNFAQSNSIWSTNQLQNSPSAKSNPQIDALNSQQQNLRDQIRQSEQNLSAQHGVIDFFLLHYFIKLPTYRYEYLFLKTKTKRQFIYHKKSLLFLLFLDGNCFTSLLFLSINY